MEQLDILDSFIRIDFALVLRREEPTGQLGQLGILVRMGSRFSHNQILVGCCADQVLRRENPLVNLDSLDSLIKMGSWFSCNQALVWCCADLMLRRGPNGQLGQLGQPGEDGLPSARGSAAGAQNVQHAAGVQPQKQHGFRTKL
eukprot:1160449-Pelagomonas_calceolata.AAC.7